MNYLKIGFAWCMLNLVTLMLCIGNDDRLMIMTIIFFTGYFIVIIYGVFEANNKHKRQFLMQIEKEDKGSWNMTN